MLERRQTVAPAQTTVRLLLAMALAAVTWLAARKVTARYVPAPQRPVVLTVITFLILAALNAVNLCAPGWCGWYGFPLHYFSWSDSMLTFDDRCFGCPAFHPLGAVANVAFATALCVFMFRRERRDREPKQRSQPC